VTTGKPVWLTQYSPRDPTCSHRGPPTNSIVLRKYGTPILNPTRTGTPTNFETQTVTLRGELLFAERVTAPHIVALYHPGWNNPRNDQQATQPNSYHVFLHPTPFWATPPPLNRDLLFFMARYLVLPWSLGKNMAHQNVADTLKNIFVMPVGSMPGANWQRDLTTQTSMYRFLNEVNFFVQRKRGIAFPRQPIGRSALSCFSAGASWLNNIIRGPKLPQFFDYFLRNVFVLDGVVGNNDAGATVALCNALSSWFRRGQEGRSLRVYTQSALWFDTLDAQISGTTKSSAPGGARERESSSCTLLHTPSTFWKHFFPDADYYLVHQLIPAEFMEHAVSNSGFAN
jgi:hypothetical protein